MVEAHGYAPLQYGDELIPFGFIDETFEKGGFINIWVWKTDKGKTRPYKSTCSIYVKCKPNWYNFNCADLLPEAF